MSLICSIRNVIQIIKMETNENMYFSEPIMKYENNKQIVISRARPPKDINPLEDRLTKTVIMDIDSKGNITDYDIT